MALVLNYRKTAGSMSLVNNFNLAITLTGGFFEKVKGEAAKLPQDHHLDQQRVRQDSYEIHFYENFLY